MRQVIAQRDVARIALDLSSQFLNEIREGVAILGLVCIVDLRLNVAALLRLDREESKELERQP